MTVRKKTDKVENKGPRLKSPTGKMDLSPELQVIREKIKTLPTEPETDMTEATAADTTAPVKKNKGLKSKGVTKKTKGVTKKTPKTAKVADDNSVALAAVAKELKITPRAARRILRTAKVKNPGRWSWAKGSADLAKAKKVLKDATAGE